MEKYIYLALLLLLYITNIISVITVLYSKKIDTSNTLAWILVFVFLPYVGFVLYFFFGSTKKLELLTKKYSLKEIEKVHKEFEVSNTNQNYDIDTDYQQLIKLNSNSTYSENNDVELFSNGREKFDSLLRDIENAKESIHLEYYIIKAYDNITDELLHLLIRKAKENVAVRVIYDKIGSYKLSYSYFKDLVDNGGEVCSFLPTLMRSAIQINYRLHRKIAVIDSMIGYTGGINIGDEYLGTNKKGHIWRDSAIRLTGDAVSSLQARFLSDWCFLERQQGKKQKIHLENFDNDYLKSFFKSNKVNNTTGVQIISSGPDEEYSKIKDTYLKMISSAKNYIYITTPYFVPDNAIIESLKIAHFSGVDIRIIIPGVPDKQYVYNVTLSNISTLLNIGIKIYTYNGFIHSKMLFIDDTITTLGTCNMDVRSFRYNYEVNAIIYNKEFTENCKIQFTQDIENSKLINKDEFNKRGINQRTKEALAKFIAPLS